MYKLEHLGAAGIRILLYLYENQSEQLGTTELIEALRIGRPTFYNKIRLMIMLDIISVSKISGKKRLSLTENGRKLAKLLFEAEMLLREIIRNA